MPGVGLLISDDGGNTWTVRAVATFLNKQIGHIIVDPTSPADVYAGTTGGLFHSPDAGVTWNEIEVNVSAVNSSGLAYALD